MAVHASGEINRRENMRGEGRNGLGHWYHESLPGPCSQYTESASASYPHYLKSKAREFPAFC